MRISSIIAMAVLAGPALAAVPPDQKAEPSLAITMTHTPPDACTLTVAGQSFALPKDDAAATSALRALRGSWTSASIGSAVDIPYRCTAAVLFVAQQAGFERIGFVGLAVPAPKRKPLKPR